MGPISETHTEKKLLPPHKRKRDSSKSFIVSRVVSKGGCGSRPHWGVMVGLNPNESRCVGLNYMCRDEVWELLKVIGLGKNIDRGHAASASPTWTSRKQDS